MGNEEQYELWRRQRSKVDIPDDFANRVMMSIHQARRRVWWSVLHKLAMVAGRSRIVRTGLFALAFAVWIMRVASVCAIFIPSGS